MSDEKPANILKLKKDQVLCVEGDLHLDMYYVQSGKFMVCLRKGTEVTPVAYIGENEFIGELSYFDHRPRSADILAIEDSTLIRISEKNKQIMPDWLERFCEYATNQLRDLSDAARKAGIRKKDAQTVQALSIDQQRHVFAAIESYQEANS